MISKLEGSNICDIRKQRNCFIFGAIFLIASIGAALPHKLESYRRLKTASENLTGLQAEIVLKQKQLTDLQNQILRIQDQIRGPHSK